MDRKLEVAIVGPGNIGSDLMYKVLRSEKLEMGMMVGIIRESEGLKRATSLGIPISYEGIQPVLDNPEIELVFDATGAKPHMIHAPLIKEAGKIAVDLTPAALGPYVVPAVNMDINLEKDNVNMVTCGGQATIPIVAAVNRVQPVAYGEIVATISSKSAGPGTRQNIDEFTETTSKAIEIVGGAKKGKAIIILNPADPAIMMRDTIFCILEDDPDEKAIIASVEEMVTVVQTYVHGYTLKVPPIIDGKQVTVMVEVQGAGDFLPTFAGNLDIMTAAATAVGEQIAGHVLQSKGVTNQ